MSLMKEFTKMYVPSESLTKPDEKILEFGRSILPKEIIDLWVNYGFGEYGNGLIKLIDPRDYMNSLYTWLGQQDFNKIPIIVTAFGDIFYYRNFGKGINDISILDIHYRKAEVCTDSYQDFFNGFILDAEIRKAILREDLYSEAVKRLGKLNYKDIFFFKPALCIGGKEDIDYVAKGNAAIHHQLLLQLGQNR